MKHDEGEYYPILKVSLNSTFYRIGRECMQFPAHVCRSLLYIVQPRWENTTPAAGGHVSTVDFWVNMISRLFRLMYDMRFYSAVYPRQGSTRVVTAIGP